MTYLDHLKRNQKPGRKRDTDGWPLCTVCETRRSRQVTDDQSECYECAALANWGAQEVAPQAPVPWPYNNQTGSRYGL